MLVQSSLLGLRVDLRCCWRTWTRMKNAVHRKTHHCASWESSVSDALRRDVSRITKENDDPIDDDVRLTEFRRCTSDCTEWARMLISPARKYTIWQVCNQQSQGSPESSKSLTSQFSEQKKRPPFRARAWCSYAHVQETSFSVFRSFFEVCCYFRVFEAKYTCHVRSLSTT